MPMKSHSNDKKQKKDDDHFATNIRAFQVMVLIVGEREIIADVNTVWMQLKGDPHGFQNLAQLVGP
jgi:hypothetical protein